MKKTASRTLPHDDMKSEYVLDYQKAKTNRFASQMDSTRTVVVLDPELSTVFPTSDAVNKVLKALVKTMPPRPAAKNRKKVLAAGSP